MHIKKRKKEKYICLTGRKETDLSRTKKVVLIIAGVLLTIVFGLYFYGMAYFQTHFKIGTELNGFHCSFMTADEAAALLSRKVSSYAIEVDTRGNGVESLTADNVGLRFDGRNELLSILARQNSYVWFIPENTGHQLSANCYALDETKFIKAVENMKCMKDVITPQSSRIVINDGVFQVLGPVEGNQLDTSKTEDVLRTAIKLWQFKIDLEKEGCYLTAPVVDENELQKKADVLNTMKKAIITFDFSDRTEKLTGLYAQDHFVNKNFDIDKELVKKYIRKNLSKKYDTVGSIRKFVAYDDGTIDLTSGTYGWKIDEDKTADKIIGMLKRGGIDVIEPVYSQEAADRNKNDIGFSYLEVDTKNMKVVLYIDGKPVVETTAYIGKNIVPGCYKIDEKEREKDGDILYIGFGGGHIASYANANDVEAALAGVVENPSVDNGVLIYIDDQNKIFDQLNDKWAIVVY